MNTMERVIAFILMQNELSRYFMLVEIANAFSSPPEEVLECIRLYESILAQTEIRS